MVQEAQLCVFYGRYIAMPRNLIPLTEEAPAGSMARRAFILAFDTVAMRSVAARAGGALMSGTSAASNGGGV